MSTRSTVTRWVLRLHFVAALVFGIPLLFFAGRAAGWVHWYARDYTSWKVLGAALVALGVGSLLASGQPPRHRALVVTQLTFEVLGALGIAYRLWVAKGYTPSFAVVPFIVLVAFAVLLGLFFPVGER